MVVIDVPQVYAQIVCAQKVFIVWRATHGVDIIVVAELVLSLFHTFVPLVNDLALWNDNLSVSSDGRLGCLSVYFIIEFPELDDSIISR